jgi:fructokinase
VIVVGGESLVDLVPVGEDRLLDPTLGGGPYNVAIAAARLGAPAAFLSRMSTDAFGDQLLQRLHASKVRTELLQRGAEPTTLAVVGLDENRSAKYSFYTEGTADRLFVDPGPLPAETTALSLGTLGMVLEPGASAYESVLRRESERGVLTMVDPNIRAQLIPDAAVYRARFASWLPSIGVLKLSDDDAAWLADGEPDYRAWLDAGVGAIVLTRGGDGLTVYTQAGAEISLPAQRVEVADTIGAGDTVHGAVLAWLHRREVRGRGRLAALDEAEWREVLDFAGRAAAITVSRHGAEPPYAAEIDGLSV